MEELACSRIFLSLASGAGNFSGLCINIFTAIFVALFCCKGFAATFFSNLPSLHHSACFLLYIVEAIWLNTSLNSLTFCFGGR